MKSKKASKTRLKVIHSLDEIPTHFDSEDDERDYWGSHTFSKELLDALPDTTDDLDALFPLPPRTMVCSMDEIPHFDSELDALHWWWTRELSDELYFSIPEGTEDFNRIQEWAERRQRAERRERAKRKVP